MKSIGAALFPRGVRIVHFIVVPAVGMGAILALFYLVDRLILPTVGPAGAEFYKGLRAVTIAVLMSSLIAFLAIRYRSDYETKLRARADDLEATRDFLTQIIQGSAEAIITLDLAGRVTSWNRAAEEIYGWSADGDARPGDRSVAPLGSRASRRTRAVAVHDRAGGDNPQSRRDPPPEGRQDDRRRR